MPRSDSLSFGFLEFSPKTSPLSQLRLFLLQLFLVVCACAAVQNCATFINIVGGGALDLLGA